MQVILLYPAKLYEIWLNSLKCHFLMNKKIYAILMKTF